MRLLASVARWETIALIASFGIVTLWKLFQSASFSGLLRSSDRTLSPGRVQLLVLTILTALQYLLATMHDPSHLPPVPADLVKVLGGSQFVYLGAKAWDIFGLNRK
jgi:sulfite exporter TauE/SafE